jgi:hypothetical protein
MKTQIIKHLIFAVVSYLGLVTVYSQNIASTQSVNSNDDCSKFTYNILDKRIDGYSSNVVSMFRDRKWNIGEGSNEKDKIENALKQARYSNANPATPVVCINFEKHSFKVQFFEGLPNRYFGMVKSFNGNYYFVHHSFIDFIGSLEYSCYGLPTNNTELKEISGISYLELPVVSACENRYKLILVGFFTNPENLPGDIRQGLRDTYPCDVVFINVM